jgi:DNA-binding NtrC family response regulator
MLPDGSGFQVIEGLPAAQFPPHVAIVTGNPAVKSLIKSVAGPNVSYLIKPLDLDQLNFLINKVEGTDAALKNCLINQNSIERHFNCLVGESLAMKNLYQLIECVANNKANVLLLGESGVGKELVAKAIHTVSKTTGPFVAANCGAISRELIVSELFGHEKGAFTGAISRKPGLFEQANGGTLFLDEITEMPIDLQPSLLRVLETCCVTRIGSIQEFKIDCRVISATNCSQKQIVQRECLREDLYFRLAVFPISVPPLRERRDDIDLLVAAFLFELNSQNGITLTVDQSVMSRLREYDWPGNVRELRHAVHRAFIMSDPNTGLLKLPDDLASPFTRRELPNSEVFRTVFDNKVFDNTVNETLIPGNQNNLSESPRPIKLLPDMKAGKSIEEVERELINLTLEQVGGNKQRAAEILGISLKTLYNRPSRDGRSISTFRGVSTGKCKGKRNPWPGQRNSPVG